MDQSQLSTMDPKLREAYERVMGTTTQPKVQMPSSTPPSVVNPAQAISDAKPPIQNLNPATPVPPPNMPNNFPQNPPLQNAANIPHPMPPATAAVNNPQVNTFTASMGTTGADDHMHAYVSQEVSDVKKSLQLIQLMYIAGGLVFFAVYALFWMKFFNLALP